MVKLMSRTTTEKDLGRKIHREATWSMFWVWQEWHWVRFYRLVQTLMFSVRNCREELKDWQNSDHGKLSVRRISARTSALDGDWFLFQPLKSTSDGLMPFLEWCEKLLMDYAELVCSTQENLAWLTGNRRSCPVVRIFWSHEALDLMNSD